MAEALTYEQIRNFINGEEGNGCTLLTTKEEFMEEKIKQNKYPNLVKLQVQCGCKENIFSVNYSTFNHQNQKQCKKCGLEQRRQKRRKPIDEVELIIKQYNFKWIDGEYINNNSYLTLVDDDGYKYYTTYGYLQSNSNPRKFHQLNPYTIENIQIWCRLNHKSFNLISSFYEGEYKDLQWQCTKENCREIFKASWITIHRGDGCPYCAGKQVGLSNCLATKNPELAAEWHPTKNGELTPYDVTANSGKSIWWLCSKNSKHIWKTDIESRNQGNGCPHCLGRLPTKEYNLLLNNPKLCEEWNYEKNDKRPEEYCPISNRKVWWKCKDCGHEWEARIGNRNNFNNGCPKCAESKGEKKIKEVCKLYNIPFDAQYTFDNLRGIGGGLLKFDVPIFWDERKTKLRMLIEFDGIFHYKKQYYNDGFEAIIRHDKLKSEYCNKNNIKLLRIPYWEFDNIEEIIKKELLK